MAALCTVRAFAAVHALVRFSPNLLVSHCIAVVARCFFEHHNQRSGQSPAVDLLGSILCAILLCPARPLRSSMRQLFLQIVVQGASALLSKQGWTCADWPAAAAEWHTSLNMCCLLAAAAVCGYAPAPCPAAAQSTPSPSCTAGSSCAARESCEGPPRHSVRRSPSGCATGIAPGEAAAQASHRQREAEMSMAEGGTD